jgi:hypothetical protein
MKDINNKVIVTKNNIDNIYKLCPVSTQTIVSPSTFEFNLTHLFNYLPYLSGVTKEDIECDLERENARYLFDGCIVTIQYENKIKGISLKETKRKSTRVKSYFLNSIMIVIFLNIKGQWKKLNVKISKNGNLHITGCKIKEHYFLLFEKIIKTLNIVSLITGEQIYNEQKENSSQPKEIKIFYHVCMKNIDFRLNFTIDREKLDTFLNTKPLFSKTGFQYCSRYEGSINTGVHVSLICDDIYEEYTDMSVYDIKENKFEHTIIQSEQIKKYFGKNRKKDSYYTFMIFASGAINLSGKGKYMEQAFKEFIEYLIINKDEFIDTAKIIEEKKKSSDEKSKVKKQSSNNKSKKSKQKTNSIDH